MVTWQNGDMLPPLLAVGLLSVAERSLAKPSSREQGGGKNAALLRN
jgi:hypothetical protein